jgi:hypothetical protein
MMWKLRWNVPMLSRSSPFSTRSTATSGITLSPNGRIPAGVTAFAKGIEVAGGNEDRAAKTCRVFAETAILYDMPTACEVQISMAAVGKPEENGYAERLMRTIKEEEVDLSEYADFHQAYRSIGRFLEQVYTHKRIHSALGYLTPAEFETNWQAKQSELVLK